MLSDDYTFTIYPWMFKKGLTAYEVVIYALILEETKRHGEFNWSLRETAESLKISVQTVVKAFKNLVNKNLVEKRSVTINGVKLCYYEALEVEK